MSNVKRLVTLCLLGTLLLVACEKPTTEEIKSNLISPPEKSEEYVYKHRDSAAGGNDREAYIWEVMKLALEATTED